MKKILALLLVVFMLLPLCLTACNDVGGEPEGTTPEQSTSSTTESTDDQKQPSGDEGGNENQGGRFSRLF